MAVSIGSSTAKVDFGQLARSMDGHAGLTVAFTMLTPSSLDATGYLFHKWTDGVTPWQHQNFLAVLQDSDEIGFFLNDGSGGGGYYARKTNDSPVVVDSLLRVVCRFRADPSQTIDIWVNGVARSMTDTAFTATITATNQGDSSVVCGRIEPSGGEAFTSTYSELAIWDHYVADWVCIGYGKGMSPRFYPHGALFHAPMWNTSHLVEWYSGTSGTNTSGTSAAHPSMYYPATPFLIPGEGVFVPGGGVEVEPEIGSSFGPLVWVEWDGSDGETRVWAPVDLPDPSTYYHGYKAPKLLNAGRVVRALSDEQGEYQGQTWEVTINDTDRDLRSLLGQTDARRHFLNRLGVMRMISEADWREKLTPRTVAIGQVRNYRNH